MRKTKTLILLATIIFPVYKTLFSIRLIIYPLSFLDAYHLSTIKSQAYVSVLVVRCCLLFFLLFLSFQKSNHLRYFFFSSTWEFPRLLEDTMKHFSQNTYYFIS